MFSFLWVTFEYLEKLIFLVSQAPLQAKKCECMYTGFDDAKVFHLISSDWFKVKQTRSRKDKALVHFLKEYHIDWYKFWP